jgi:3-phytase
MIRTLPVLLAAAALLLALGCGEEKPAIAPDALEPEVVTEPALHDTDDPSIWLHPDDPALSLIVGTDKDEEGALYVYDLAGQVVDSLVRRGLRRPNNVDIAHGLPLDGDTVDIAVTTERYENRLRVFALPGMEPVDGGGIPVFDGEELRAPMGIALYTRPSDHAIFAVVSRKEGPDGSYLWQYRLEDDGGGRVAATHVRSFGGFSGTGEIEAIAVDDELGYIYYSDEAFAVRKYPADPEAGAGELAHFGEGGQFAEDREGISIYQLTDSTGYILVSDQQANRFNIYPREGAPGDPHRHELLASVPVSTMESDGSEVTGRDLGPPFASGLFVAMSEGRTFHYYRWEQIAERAGLAVAAASEDGPQKPASATQ